MMRRSTALFSYDTEFASTYNELLRLKLGLIYSVEPDDEKLVNVICIRFYYFFFIFLGNANQWIYAGR